MTDKTIIVSNSFGKDKTVTANDFTGKWANLIDQMMYLVENQADIDSLKGARVMVAAMARRKFDIISKAQNG